MGRRNKIRRLPPQIREEVDRLLDEAWTLDDIVAHLKTLKVDVSRSGLHRYSKEWADLRRELATTREASEQLARDIGATATDDGGRLLIETLRAIMLKTSMAMATSDGVMGMKDIHDLAKAFDHWARAKAKTIDIENAARAAANAAAAETAAKVVAQAGLSAATVQAIKSEILGQAV